MNYICTYSIVFLCINVKYLCKRIKIEQQGILINSSFADILLGELLVSRRNKIKLGKIGD